MYKVIIRATSVLVTPGGEASKLLMPLLELFHYEDEFVEESRVLGYVLDEVSDTLYLHKGVDLNYIRRLLIDVEFVNDPYDDYKNINFEYDEIVPPRNEEQEDVINFIAGLNRHAYNTNKSQLFLVKAPGFGKCEPYSRKIPTPTSTGYTLMGDLKIGDYVFDNHGHPTVVDGIFDQGEKDVYEVTFTDGRIALCGKEHLWNVRSSDNGEYETKTLRNIMISHNKCLYRNKYYIPTCSPVNYPHQEVPIDPWVLGCFINSGLLDKVKLTLKYCDENIPERIAQLYDFNVEIICDVDKCCNHYEFRYRDGSAVRTEDFFKDLPIMNNKLYPHKSIPLSYVINDVKTRMELIRGFMDINGNVSFINREYKISYESYSYGLLGQILDILHSLGYSGSIRRSAVNYLYPSTLTMTIPDNNKKDFFNAYTGKHEIAKRASFLPKKESYDSLEIVDIQYSHKEKCRCITVNNPEHLYLTEDYIVTHNTYCSSVGLCKFGAKALIIMHRESLRTQWLESLYKMTGFSNREVHEIVDGEELYDIANGNISLNYDVYLMTHATFRAGLRRIGNLQTAGNITKNLGIGLKIIDEAHLEFRSTILIDFVFNVQRNLYLTATDGRSNKDENSIFRHVFCNAEYYKKDTNDLPSKWVEYNIIEINTHCKQNIYRYRVVSGRGMTPASYGKWVIQYDKNQTHFKVCRELLRTIYERDDKAKALVFMPLIELCEESAYFFKMGLNYDDSFPLDLTVKTINSTNTKTENERNKKSDVIVTTIASCGTGTDIPGITDIICCVPYISKITANQVFGRIRFCGKLCHYYDIVDTSVQMDVFWLKSRSKTLKQLALAVKYISWSDDTNAT